MIHLFHNPTSLLAAALYISILVSSILATPIETRQSLLPPPADPAGDAGDGESSGVWKSGGSPSLGERLILAKCKLLITGGKIAGYKNAAAHMEHYLDNTGTDLHLNVEAMMIDLPNFKSGVQALAQNSAKAAYTKASKKGVDVSETFTTPWTLYGYTPSTNFDKSTTTGSDWFYAEGAFSYAVSGEVTISKAGHVSLRYVAYVFDRYNWDYGKGVTIGGHGISDEEMGKLNKVGLARVYNVRGTSKVNTIATYDPTKTLPTPSTEGGDRGR
ncbi:hypothetical protein B0J14DRAFT_605188 [Halenospora varia]|nr:hypothetical protein B0J14DRAFT_605188 [Halenospora varia]